MRRQRGAARSNKHRGAALLLAMIVLTLVATVAAGMVWQQSRAIEVEGAERARAQAGWMMSSGIDFAREVVRRYADADPRRDQPWDVVLAETRLSSLLAADRDNNADSSLEAFISGRIADAQSRYNLRNLIGADGVIVEAERKTLRRLCDAIGLSGVDELLASGLRQALGPSTADGSSTSNPIAPSRPEQLAWLGLDPATLARLTAYVEFLPAATPINLNTASREVIYAVFDGIDLATAARIVRQRNNRFLDLAQFKSENLVPETLVPAEARITFKSQYFHVQATVRYEDRALTEQALLQLRGTGTSAEVVVVRRERRPALASTAVTSR